MPTAKERSRERRWVVLGTDGRYVTLGRNTDPSEDEITQAEDALRAQGLAGWLAIMEGNPYIGAVPHLIEVRPLAAPGIDFDVATATCVRAIAERRASLEG
jgi:hypothetical protein